jgi:hypothetical protein
MTERDATITLKAGRVQVQFDAMASFLRHQVLRTRDAGLTTETADRQYELRLFSPATSFEQAVVCLLGEMQQEVTVLVAFRGQPQPFSYSLVAVRPSLEEGDALVLHLAAANLI